LAGKVTGLDRQAGGIAAWPCHARDQTAAYGVSRHREHDRDGRCCRFGGESGCGRPRGNYVALEPDELGRDLSGALATSLRPADFDHDIAAIDPTEFAHSLHKSGEPLACNRS